ncbi:hypothetical protein QYF36_002849 [Acer negundo]|nr:hypothetical protein QYF36_002849 [Acer negundo]
MLLSIRRQLLRRCSATAGRRFAHPPPPLLCSVAADLFREWKTKSPDIVLRRSSSLFRCISRHHIIDSNGCKLQSPEFFPPSSPNSIEISQGPMLEADL